MTNETQAKPAGEMTVAELRAELEEGGLTVPGDAKKGDLVGLVDRARADAAAAEPADPEEEVAGEVVAESDEPAPPVEPQAPAEAPETATVPPEVADEVGQAIALREQAVAPVSALPSPQEFNASMAVANEIARTSFVPESYRGRPADVVAAILFGRELGLGPMTALRDIHMIDGRPALAAHRQLALLRKGGVRILESEATAVRCFIRAQRQDTGEAMAVEFTYEEAEKIRRKGKALVDGDNWRNYPADMLWARTVGRLTRRLGPDLLNGLPPYVAEEVADFSGWGVEYVEGELATRERRQAEPVRIDPSYNVPTSWAELAERLGLMLGPEDAREWLTQSIASAYGGKATGELSTDERAQAFQKACAALHVFDTDESLPGDLHFASRATLAGVFGRFFGGELVEGPPWALGPEEAETRPSRAEALGRPEAESAAPATETPQDAPEARDGAEGAPGAASEGDYAPGMKPVDDIDV